MEVLTAYVRDVARPREPVASARVEKGPHAPTASQEPPESTAKLPADVQAILTVLGRRRTDYEQGSPLALDLTGTHLSGADLSRADLSNAELRVADLRGAGLSDARLSHAHLGRADLSGAHLSRTRGVTQVWINEACLDEKTELPRGFTRPPPCQDEPLRSTGVPGRK
jgi:hypothetical protein